MASASQETPTADTTNQTQASLSQGLRSTAALHWRNGLIVVGVLALVWLLASLSPVLSPFLIGMGFAYLCDPLADRLEEKGFSRMTAVIIVFSVITTLLTAVLLILIPLLSHQFQLMIKRIPEFLNWFEQTAIPWVNTKTGYDINYLDVDRVREAALSSWQDIGGMAAIFGKHFASSSMAFLSFLTNLCLVPVVTFYLLKDWDLMIAKLRQLLPRRIEPQVSTIARECNEVISAFLRGQLLVMLALGFMYSLGLWAIGIDLAVLIGMLSGLASIVPYLGTVVGIIAALIAAVVQYQDFLHPVLVCLVFVSGQMIEGTLLTPLLVGDRIGLHPVAVIFAVLAGAQLFGFVGMLLALPVAAVILVMLRYAHKRYLNSAMYQNDTSTPAEQSPQIIAANSVTAQDLDRLQ